MDWEWKSYFLNAPFRNLLSHADYIVIHNNTIKKLLSESAKRKALIVYDPWPYIDLSTNQRDGDYLVFPASYHPDEPLKEILDCARNNFPNVQLYVTGDWRRHPSVKQYESKNIVFTSYLSEKGYDDLISGARGIITGTKEEYTILMSAWEAVAYKKPLAITKTLALRDTYAEYPVYYDWKDQRSISLAMQSLLSQSQFKDNTALREKVLQSMTEFKEKISLLLS